MASFYSIPKLLVEIIIKAQNAGTPAKFLDAMYEKYQ
jgi:hypothetical protein